MTDTGLTLISHPLCPFVQRAAIVLLEKGVAFKRVNIDLSVKPDWFLALSPTVKPKSGLGHCPKDARPGSPRRTL
jgi:glutathione S-transferase